MPAPVIYDWPTVIPVRQLYHSGGQAVESVLTAGAVRVLSPEPGGFGLLEMEFGRVEDADTLVSWLLSKIANGNVFRIPITRSPQLVSAAALGIAIDEYDPLRRFGMTETVTPSELDGLPWETGVTWLNGGGWMFSPVVLATAVSLAGSSEIAFDMGTLANGLRHGHVIGHRDTAYLVEDISYAGSVATVTVDPPLRSAVAVDDMIRLRPKATFMATNPQAFRGLYDAAGLVQLGSASFVEAIV